MVSVPCALPLVKSKVWLFGPVMAEIALAQLTDREVFGPVLHVVRYKNDELEEAARALAAKGYGLTLGIHSRLASFVAIAKGDVPARHWFRLGRTLTPIDGASGGHPRAARPG